MSLIDTLVLPEDLKKLSSQDLEKVAGEIREKIIDVVSASGGHLSSSLGTVELSVALHAVFQSPKDKLLWDVGHQAYAHKILTGRLKEFSTLRKMGGLSGFPKRTESPHDIFTEGHASNSISQALGIAKARDLANDNYYVAAVLGDGSLSGGLALEGINNLMSLKSNLIIILNDNQMCISKPVGAISNYLTKVRTSSFYVSTKERVERLIKRIPRIGEPMVKSAERLKDRFKHFFVDFKFGVIFEELGFKYLGPIDGHNIALVMSTLNFAKEVKGPVLIHAITRKGKGYAPAEEDPVKFHGIGPFDKATGKVLGPTNGLTYTSAFGKALIKIAQQDKRVVGITAAMLDGTGLDDFAQIFPDRFFDVGIAEEHAISFASGLASQGFKPVAAIYSTFLQRAYDQIVHDVCLNNLPVIFAIDRAGLVGEDGPTHHGVFDIAYLRSIPNMVVMAPSDEDELGHMLFTAVKYNGPVSIRYPKGNGPHNAPSDELREIGIGKGEVAYSPSVEASKKKILLVSVGSMVYPSIEAAKLLGVQGISATVINARYIKPVDGELIKRQAQQSDLIITVEEGVLKGGFGSAVLELLEKEDIRVPARCMGIPDVFVCHGKRAELLKKYNLDHEGIANFAKKELEL